MASENQKSQSTDNILVRIVDGLINWSLALFGKKKTSPRAAAPSGQATPQSTTSGGGKPDEEGLVEVGHEEFDQEDSVASDIKTVKSILNKGFGAARMKMAPKVTSVKAGAVKAVSEAPKRFNFAKIGKLIPVLAVVVILALVVTTLPNLVKKVQTEIVKRNGGGDVVTVSPTPASYEPQTPSVYADDPQVLQLEENLTVLSREISGKVLRESNLTPPRLDFNISF